MKRKRASDEFDRRAKPDPHRELERIFARMQLETEKQVRRLRAELDDLFRAKRDEMDDLLRRWPKFLGSVDPRPKPPRKLPPKRRRKGGGSEAVTVEPNRPKLGEGGAAAALEYDE